jgi:hypothetical protein
MQSVYGLSSHGNMSFISGSGYVSSTHGNGGDARAYPGTIGTPPGMFSTMSSTPQRKGFPGTFGSPGMPAATLRATNPTIGAPADPSGFNHVPLSRSGMANANPTVNPRVLIARSKEGYPNQNDLLFFLHAGPRFPHQAFRGVNIHLLLSSAQYGYATETLDVNGFLQMFCPSDRAPALISFYGILNTVPSDVPQKDVTSVQPITQGFANVRDYWGTTMPANERLWIVLGYRVKTATRAQKTTAYAMVAANDDVALSQFSRYNEGQRDENERMDCAILFEIGRTAFDGKSGIRAKTRALSRGVDAPSLERAPTRRIHVSPGGSILAYIKPAP